MPVSHFWQGGVAMSEDKVADGYDVPSVFFEAIGNLFVRNGNFHITAMKVHETPGGGRLLIPQTELICPLGNVPGHVAAVCKSTSKWVAIPLSQEVAVADRAGRH